MVNQGKNNNKKQLYSKEVVHKPETKTKKKDIYSTYP